MAANGENGIQVISRAAQILRQLKRDNEGLSLGTIASKTGLPRSTVQRIVGALVAEGFIANSDKQGDLRLGPEIQSLAAAGRLDVASIVRPWLQKLSEETGETVDLAIFAFDHMTFIDQIPGSHRLCAVSVPGEDFPLTTTANGKAALSLLREEEAVQAFRQEQEGGALATFLRERGLIKETGIALDLDEHTVGISAAGIAFQSVAGETISVSIPAPTSRFNQCRDEIEKALIRFAHMAVLPSPYFQQCTVQDHMAGA